MRLLAFRKRLRGVRKKGEGKMRITDLLDKRSISLDAAPKSKSEALDMAVDLMVKSEKISDREAYRKQVYLREEESTTGIGEGIAIPHGKCFRWLLVAVF